MDGGAAIADSGVGVRPGVRDTFVERSALCGASEPVSLSLDVLLLAPGFCGACEESCSQLPSTRAVKQRCVAKGCSRDSRSVLLRVVVFACGGC